MQFLFTLLTQATSSDIRTNIIVGIGDLACRFPNTVEPWTNHVYNCLHDKDKHVRKHTLMVLTHLVLNDMIKIKANISDIARCIEDEDECIVNLTKSFFNELSRRATATNNPIYNLLPEILSRLSSSEDLSEESFRNIMKYILSFITRDRQTEQLVEKLCQRFKAITDNIDQWRDLAFCISLINLNEKCVRKIIDSLKYYQHALVDDGVFDVMKQVADKGKKISAKPSSSKSSSNNAKEYKQLLEEWEKRIDEIHAKLGEDSAYYQRLKDGSTKVKQQIAKEDTQNKENQEPVASEEQKPRKQRRTAIRKNVPRSSKRISEEEEESEPELLSEEEPEIQLSSDEEEKPKRKKSKRKRVIDEEEEQGSKRQKVKQEESKKPKSTTVIRTRRNRLKSSGAK